MTSRLTVAAPAPLVAVSGQVTFRGVPLPGGLIVFTPDDESGFHGAEPTEQRWGFQPSPNGHAVDSYSTRITFSPAPNWTSQYSIAHIVSPEALYPNENQQRQTAAAHG